MFRKTKVKIVCTIMTVLVILWAGTLFFILTSYFREVTNQNYEMLVQHAHMYVSESFLEEDLSPPPESENPDFLNKPEFALTTFYTVAFSDDGRIFETMNDKPTVHSNEELEELAKRIVYEYGTDVGTEGKLSFYHIDKGSYDLVVFIDNTLILGRLNPFFRYLWLYSAGTFVVFLLLSIVFANVIVRPLEKNYKYQKQFVSNASHELKTPISVINTNAEMLARNIGENQWLSNIQYENQRMGLLVTHLLELSRTENVPMSMKTVDFSKLVKGESLPFESVAFENGLTLNCNITPGINAYGNSTQLKQVVSVLLDNAIQYCNKESTEIQLHLTKDFYRYAKLRVINSGEEISKEECKRIFERFYRVNNTSDKNDNHYGLGLSIAKNIIDSHRGKIQIFSHDGIVEVQVLIPMNKY